MIEKNNIENAVKSIIDNSDKELFGKTEKQLEDYWFFKYDKSLSKEYNLYKFTKLLELYRSHCERWEDHFNGHVCVVERVRDKYLMAKIEEFLKHIENLNEEKNDD